MKKHSVLFRLAAVLLALVCLVPSALAEQTETQQETQYVITDGPSANSELAFGSV